MTLVELDEISTGYIDGIEDLINFRITPGVAGLYIVSGQVAYENAIIDKLYRAQIYRNWGIGGSRRVAFNERYLEYAGGVQNIHCYGEVWLDEDDYVELYAYNFSGVDTVDVTLGEINTFLVCQRIR